MINSSGIGHDRDMSIRDLRQPKKLFFCLLGGGGWLYHHIVSGPPPG